MPCYKAGHGFRMIRTSPEKWMGTTVIEYRDFELLMADQLPFIEYTSNSSYVRSVYAQRKPETAWVKTDWLVGANDKAMGMISQAGGRVFDLPIAPRQHMEWESVAVNVNIKGTLPSGFTWGYFSTVARKVRIFKGPPESCEIHPWDAMILRDCMSVSPNLNDHDPLGKQKWDILAIKGCEDFDHAWVVASIKDAGGRD